MRHEEFTNIRRAVESGEDILVQNRDLLYVGRVMACVRNQVRVDAFGHRFDWDPDRCRAVDRRVFPLGPPNSN